MVHGHTTSCVEGERGTREDVGRVEGGRERRIGQSGIDQKGAGEKDCVSRIVPPAGVFFLALMGRHVDRLGPRAWGALCVSKSLTPDCVAPRFRLCPRTPAAISHARAL